MRYYCCIMKDPNNPDAGWEYPDSPLMDVRVRKALNKAINRDELNKALFDGKGEPMYVTQHHQTRLGWDPSWVQRWPDEYGYDPALLGRCLPRRALPPASRCPRTSL